MVDVNEIRDALAKATDAPWQWAASGRRMSNLYSQPYGVGSTPGNLVAGCFGDGIGGGDAAKANAYLIAHAPAWLASACDALEARDEQITCLHADLARVSDRAGQVEARLNAEVARLLKTLAEYIPDRVVACRGDKCRLPWCVSCCGDDDAQRGLDQARSALETPHVS